ncbi:hypothetical protein FO441_11915 [Salinicoccus cyprini]|uniref:Uncharacterized protein n=1 Tax=Salinicoccus cyprini TaxID=2493691 RepID=A0A558AR37_9STAP|nr:hypothetical protein [Salinicoccus cyprini]TVT26708.1 hypothetical protein FO441_11915 [Salinicoccus cyprini]
MKRLTAIALVVLLAGCGEDESQAAKDLETVNQENKSLENRIQNIKEENSQLEENIGAKEAELESLREEESGASEQDDEKEAENQQE